MAVFFRFFKHIVFLWIRFVVSNKSNLKAEILLDRRGRSWTRSPRRAKFCPCFSHVKVRIFFLEDENRLKGRTSLWFAWKQKFDNNSVYATPLWPEIQERKRGRKNRDSLNSSHKNRFQMELNPNLWLFTDWRNHKYRRNNRQRTCSTLRPRPQRDPTQLPPHSRELENDERKSLLRITQA